jgi:hypothetical protein
MAPRAIACALVLGVVASAPRADSALAGNAPGGAPGADKLLVERKYRITARDVTYDLDHRHAHAEGDAVLTYEGQEVQFRADVIDGDLEAGTISAAGNVSLQQGRNCLYARAVTYDLEHRTGALDQAHGQVQGIYFAAEALRATPKQLVLSNGSFTTCDLSRPDYHVTAGEIIVRPGDRLISRRSALWFKGHRLVTLPTFDISLRRPQRVTALSPVGGFSRRDGAFAGQHYTILPPGAAAIELDARYTTQRGIRAFGRGEFYPRWGLVSVGASRREDVTASDLGLFAPAEPIRDLTLDRLPEIAVASNVVPLGRWGAATARIAAGRYLEFPSRVRASRAAADIYLQGRAIGCIKGMSLRPLAGVRGAWYDTRQHRSAFAYGFAAESRPSDHLAVRFGYIERRGSGAGPFLFDAIDISRELGLGLSGRLGSHLRTEILARHDLDSGTFPVLNIAVIRVAHCLEYGVTWRKVGGEFGVRIGLTQAGALKAPGW